MVEESKRAERVRDERVRDVSKEPVKHRPKDADFDKVLEKSRLAAQINPSAQSQSKLLTEEAIKEAAKREDRQGDERKRDDDEGKGDRDSRQKGERTESGAANQRVVAKNRLKQGSGGGSGQRESFGGGSERKNLTRVLTKTGAKSVPLDLQGKFAARLAKSIKEAGAPRELITQQVLNKIVQYVRIGINQKGEKEILLELHERIFRGMKLRVVARGGKVGVYFMLVDPKGREAFKKNSSAIRDALKKKGIEVDEILVS